MIALDNLRNHSPSSASTTWRRSASRAATISACLLLSSLAAVPGPALSAAPPSTPSRELPSFIDLVKQYGQAVVNVSSSRKLPPQSAELPIPEGEPLHDFFRRFMPPPGQDRGGVARSMGSGFIISRDGYILTNAHVVSEADTVTVTLTNKREFQAKVLGADLYTDVALLKIDARDLPPVKIGDPNALDAGAWVAAIGAPFGLQNSITAGVVSAKGRLLPNESYVPFIQTDVAVNPGNSGGPLFNLNGEVVGINSMIYSGTGGFMGLSFAIPIDIAMNIADQIRTTGKVTRSRIGVQAQELSRELATSFGLKDANGALVAMVEKGGPADTAGVRQGDIVLSIDGRAVQTSADLARLVAVNKPGSTVVLDVWRKGARLPLKLETVELQAPQLAQLGRGGAGAGARTTGQSGLAVSDLPLEQRRSLGIESGVLVQNTEGPAAQAGISRGDIILSLNDATVRSAAQLESLLLKNRGGTVALLIQRGSDTMYVPLKLGVG